MYGLIYKGDSVEWWVRRKEKGKSDFVITRELFEEIRGKLIKVRVTEYELDYVLSKYCDCPVEVKRIAKELLNKLSK